MKITKDTIKAAIASGQCIPAILRQVRLVTHDMAIAAHKEDLPVAHHYYVKLATDIQNIEKIWMDYEPDRELENRWEANQ